MALFDKALSAERILAHYQSQFAEVGGAVTGILLPINVVCRNFTTGQIIRQQISDTSWDCEAMGLIVNSGDRVGTSARGIAE